MLTVAASKKQNLRVTRAVIKKVLAPAGLPGVVRAKARKASQVSEPCVKADLGHQTHWL